MKNKTKWEGKYIKDHATQTLEKDRLLQVI